MPKISSIRLVVRHHMLYYQRRAVKTVNVQGRQFHWLTKARIALKQSSRGPIYKISYDNLTIIL